MAASVKKLKPCLVMGNGPSAGILASYDLKCDIIGCNHLSQHRTSVDFPTLRYYALFDPAYVHNVELLRSSIGSLCSSFPAATLIMPDSFLLPMSTASLISLRTEFVRYKPSLPLWDADINDILSSNCYPGIQTVTQAMLFHAIRLEYSPIYLIGVECDGFTSAYGDLDGLWHRDFRHFYDRSDSYCAKRYPLDIKEELLAYLRVFTGFEALAYLARTKSLNVINLSEISLLDCFPKVQISQVGMPFRSKTG